jgi:hypothetical protein
MSFIDDHHVTPPIATANHPAPVRGRARTARHVTVEESTVDRANPTAYGTETIVGGS